MATADGVRTLTFDDPERNNAWTLATEHRYFGLLAEAELDPAVRVVLVTAAGRHFCPGMDFQSLGASSAGGGFDFSGRRPNTFPLTIRKPIVAAINGGCAGIGLLQALCCDVRFAAEGARFSTAYARRGLPAEYGFAWLLPRLIGVPRALDLLLSARTFDAAEAERLGLVARVVPADELVPVAHAYAADLAANCSPRSMAAIRLQVYGDLDGTLDESMARSKELMQDFAAAPDLAEGIASYRDRRPPAFPPLDPAIALPG